mmetsp:Transcript_33252/g.94210  ORF Transcript_33252/g.94210 Transcript_33252/m.94210 type:complete len:546 (+) Transcript_33252:247-1884(+)
MIQRSSGAAEMELRPQPWEADLGEARPERQDVTLLIETSPDTAATIFDKNNNKDSRRRSFSFSYLRSPGISCLLISNILLLGLLIVQTIKLSRERPEGAPQLLQTDVTPGSNIWQMFRRTDVCPWTDTPEMDADCVYRRQVSKHIMDSILRCGLESEPQLDVFARNDNSISHRGMPLVAPEHSLTGYDLARRAGAGFIECDASVTKDVSLVCRHSTCDLHTSTDILRRHSHLATKCSVPFKPATDTSPAAVECCTYDFTVAELKQLCLQMDADVNGSAVHPGDYSIGPPGWRSTALEEPCHRVVTYSEYLGWVRSKNLNAIPELKDTGNPGVQAFLKSSGILVKDLANTFLSNLLEAGFTQHMHSHAGELKWQSSEGPKAIMQTFDRTVALHWKSVTPTLPVLYLYEHTSGACGPSDCGKEAIIRQLVAAGVEIMAPPLNEVVTSVGHRMAPSDHARFLNDLPVGIASWTLDRSGCPGKQPGSLDFAGPCGGYWEGMEGVSAFEWSDIVLLMYELYYNANVTAAFSDYPSVNTIFLNCVPKKLQG